MRNKYFARTCYVDGIKFPSKHEAEWYLLLKNRQKKGEIYNLKLQQRYEIVPAQKHGKETVRAAYYIADFSYTDANTGKLVVEDAKGYRDSVAYQLFRLKKKLMLYRYGIWVHEV